MNETEDRDIVLYKISCLKNELVLKNNHVILAPTLLDGKFDRNVYVELNNLLSYRGLDKIIYKYLEEKRKYNLLEHYEDTTIFAKKNYEKAWEAVVNILNDDDAVSNMINWFDIYENQQIISMIDENTNEIEQQIKYDDWEIPDEKECREDEESYPKTRRY